MPDKPVFDRPTFVQATAGRFRRSAINALMRTPLYRLRLMGPRATEVLFVPQDLRTMDPTFVTEVEHGHMGLAGFVVDLAGRSPFEIVPPNRAWEERLQAFSWLRHMRSARDEGGDVLAKRFVAEWIARNPVPRGRGFEPAILARRILSWLCNAGLLLENADARSYAAILHSLEMQMTQLASSYGQAPPGLARLNALMALVYAGLCIADQERLLDMHEPLFLAELDRQILPSGGHVTRSCGGVVELLIDLLPLTQCFVARDRPVPPQLRAAIKRIHPWISYMRMGDGQLARFHGAGTPMSVNLATVLAYDDVLTRLTPDGSLGYLRADAGRTILLMDAGAPPPLEHAGDAHAGCLSFELSTANQLLIVNCGAPAARDMALRELGRSTAAHSTLAIEGASSSKLVPSRFPGHAPGAWALTGPATVRSRIAKLADGAMDIEASHDGYLDRFGVVHTRALRLSADGRRLDGRDRLAHPDAKARIMGDIPFGIHFHLQPDVRARLGDGAGTAELALANGEAWRLSVRGAASLAFEESEFLSDASGPRRCVQIVLRGRCLDSVEVHWRLEQVQRPEPSKRAGQE
jgi:uncharacterized heparinase superfamily protein